MYISNPGNSCKRNKKKEYSASSFENKFYKMTDSNGVRPLSWSLFVSTNKLLPISPVRQTYPLCLDILEKYQNLSVGRAHVTNSTIFL